MPGVISIAPKAAFPAPRHDLERDFDHLAEWRRELEDAAAQCDCIRYGNRHVKAHDNTFSNFRMVDLQTGIRLRGSGNFLTNIHPLLSGVSNKRFFDDTIGFDDNSNNNSYQRCYSDQFSTGWLFGPKSDNADLDGCIRKVGFYDALIPAAANKAGCSTIYTEDLNDGQKYGNVKAVNPFKG